MYFLEAVTFPLICFELGEKVVDIKENYFNTTVPVEGRKGWWIYPWLRLFSLMNKTAHCGNNPHPVWRGLSTKLVFYNQLNLFYFYFLLSLKHDVEKLEDWHASFVEYEFNKNKLFQEMWDILLIKRDFLKLYVEYNNY